MLSLIIEEISMQLLEEYQELIERDTAEISYFWKIVQMFLYLLCAISGYVCSVLFYIIWYHVFGGTCPLWAKTILMLQPNSESHCKYNSNYMDWWKCVIVIHEYKYICSIYLATCFLSCMIGILWMALFVMCTRGGHNSVIYEAPWRIVFPALFCNFLFAIITCCETYNLQGYKEFSTNIQNHFLEVHNVYKLTKNISECEIMQMYAEMYKFDDHDICNIFFWLQIFSRMMMWTWIGGTVTLILRVIMVIDFRLLKVRIYEVPDNYDIATLNNSEPNVSQENEKQKEKKQ